MYYDSLFTFARYVIAILAAGTTIISAIAVVTMLQNNSQTQDTNAHDAETKIQTSAARLAKQIERSRFWTLSAFCTIIVQSLITIAYCASSINRFIAGLLVEKVCSSDPLVARLSHVQQVIIPSFWITLALSLTNLLLVILIRRKRLRWNNLLGQPGTPTNSRSA